MSATVPLPEPLPEPVPLTAATVRGWQAQRAEVDRRLAPCFRRSEARQRAGAYVDGLLSDARRKNGWQLAETAGDATPYGVQHLLGRAVWSADRVRDGLFAYVAEPLGDAEGVVVIDETGFPKQGAHSAGVGRQSCGTLGKVGNCQVGVFLACVGARGHTLPAGSCTGPRPGPRTRPGCRPWGWPRTRPSRPSRSWPGACWNGCWRRGRPWPG